MLPQYENLSVVLSPEEKRIRDSLSLAASWRRHGKSVIQVKIHEASGEQMGTKEAKMTTFHQMCCVTVKEPLREDFPFAV